MEGIRQLGKSAASVLRQRRSGGPPERAPRDSSGPTIESEPRLADGQRLRLLLARPQPEDFPELARLCAQGVPPDPELLSGATALLQGRLEPDPTHPGTDALAMACLVLARSGRAGSLQLPDLERPGQILPLSQGLWQRSLALDPDYVATHGGDLARLLAPEVPAALERLEGHPDPLAAPEGRLALAVASSQELPEVRAASPELQLLADRIRMSQADRLTRLIGQPGQDAYALSEQADRMAEPHWPLSQRLKPMLAWAALDKSRNHEGIRLLARGLVDPLVRGKAAAELVGHPELDVAGRYLRHLETVRLLQDPEDLNARERAELYQSARLELTGLDEVRHELFPACGEPHLELKEALVEGLGTDLQPLLRAFDPAALAEALGAVRPGPEHRELIEELGRKIGPENVLAALPSAMAAFEQGQAAAVQAGQAAHLAQPRSLHTGVSFTEGGVRVGGTLLKARTRV